MKKTELLILIVGVSLLASCAQKTPEELAKESCDCHKEAMSYQNTTKQLNKLDDCFKLSQNNLSELQQVGVDNDWDDEKVNDAKDRYSKTLNECDGTTDSE